jgi:transposase InsO family protein
MKENGLLAPQRPVQRDAHPHDGTIVTDKVDQVWGTDMTQTVTIGEGRAYVFIAVDHCSGELIGNHASSSASRWEALEPIRQGVTRHFGCVGPNTALGLILRHDHGSNYMSDDFQSEIKCFGICQRRSKNRPRGGAKPGHWRRAKRHGARAPHIAGACHGALARRANPATGDQVAASAFRARLWPSR